MENWTADSNEPKKFSQDRLNGCHICVLLVAFRRGFVPDGEIRSITQLEYDAAIERGIDVLVFQLEEAAKWWAKYDEREKDPLLKEWRDSLGKKHVVQFFTDEPRSIDMTWSSGTVVYKDEVDRPSERDSAHRVARMHIALSGLDWFDEKYAPLFFGRDREVDELIDKTRRTRRPIPHHQWAVGFGQIVLGRGRSLAGPGQEGATPRKSTLDMATHHARRWPRAL